MQNMMYKLLVCMYVQSKYILCTFNQHVYLRKMCAFVVIFIIYLFYYYYFNWIYFFNIFYFFFCFLFIWKYLKKVDVFFSVVCRNVGTHNFCSSNVFACIFLYFCHCNFCANKIFNLFALLYSSSYLHSSSHSLTFVRCFFLCAQFYVDLLFSCQRNYLLLL